MNKMNKQDEHLMAAVFLNGLVHQGRMESIDEGLKAAVREYYDDYTDAMGLHSDFYRAIRSLSEYGSMDHDDLIEEVEDAITAETGRKFTRRD